MRVVIVIFFFKQETAYEMRISDWSSDVCSSDLAGIAAVWIHNIAAAPLNTSLAVPFLKDVLINLGWFMIPFAIFVMIGASNAVNLTDALDGLAIVPVMIAAASFGLICYLVGNTVFANYLQTNTVARAGELAVLCGALRGAGLG